MIQRLGRALRTKRDNRSARIVIAYAMDTWEDPMTNGHRREFVQIAKEAAENLRDFGAEWSPREVFQFLDPESESNARYALSDELPMHTALLA